MFHDVYSFSTVSQCWKHETLVGIYFMEQHGIPLGISMGEINFAEQKMTNENWSKSVTVDAADISSIQEREPLFLL